MYQLWMYDSWGDGWDDKKLEIYNTTNGEASEANLVNSYWLENGYKDHKLMCEFKIRFCCIFRLSLLKYFHDIIRSS